MGGAAVFYFPFRFEDDQISGCGYLKYEANFYARGYTYEVLLACLLVQGVLIKFRMRVSRQGIWLRNISIIFFRGKY